MLFAYGPAVLILTISPVNERMLARHVSIAAEGTAVRYMFILLALLLFFTWIGAFVFFHVVGAMIHFLLLLAIVFFIIHLFRGRRAA